MIRALFLSLMLLLNSCFGGVAQAQPGPLLKHIPLAGTINADNAKTVIVGLMLADMNPQKPQAVVIDIDSGGGEFDAGFAIVKAIEASTIPIICVVDGEASSMAFYILQSCDTRVMTSRSTLMWHSVSLAGMPVNATNIDGLRQRLDVMNAASLAHVSKKLKIAPAEVASKIERHDWWMASQEALAVGAVDSVIP